MDIDKDGYICDADIATCLKHLDSDTFFKDGGAALLKPQFNAREKFFTVKDSDQIND